MKDHLESSNDACWIQRLRCAGTILMRAKNEGAFPWLLYENPQRIITTSDVQEVMPLLEEIDAEARSGAEVCGFLAYEAAPAMDPAMDFGKSEPSQASMPLLWFGVYGQPEKLAALPELDASDCFVGPWQPNRSPEEYGHDFGKIKDYIAAGDTYQINYTLRLDAAFHGSAYALFQRLYQRQPTEYAAFLNLGSHAICSVSPELFFERHGNTITSKPMKGTRPCCGDETARLANRDELAASEKDRAENTMIVDMIRNDLGRIARSGSVETPSLFDIEEHPTVWQMTSTVRCQSDARLPEIFAAMFPCASITGAPKIRSMEIIHELEKRPRGVYTGTIGRATAKEARFSVAIRTAEVDLARNRVEYGCGGGIVWDSQETAELEECHTKAKVITQESSSFELLETMLFRRNRYFLLDKHLDRLAASARFFGFPFDRQECQRHLQEFAEELQSTRCRVRLLLTDEGQFRLEAKPFSKEIRRVWKLQLAQNPVDSTNPFLYHKTTRRDVYQCAIERASSASEPGVGKTFDDVLLFNERGEVTESTIANLLVRIGDQIYTPPVESGLLNGTFRQALLAGGRVQEKRVAIEDLNRADELFLANSVRGLIRAIL